jgi:formamidase
VFLVFVLGIVDIPNACTTMGLPMDIFDFDISPQGAIANGGVKAMDLGSCAYTSDRK